MKLFITGATGFVGSAVTAAALDRGHQVRALVRPSSSGASLGSLLDEPALEAARLDLRSRAGLVEALDGIDTVLHLAAAKEGDFYTQFAGTVVATENLLAAMSEAGVRQLVAVSTFSVYDYLTIKAGTVVDERSPIDREPSRRDEYAQTKLIQERLYRQFGADDEKNKIVILRPGMIYGGEELWHDLLGTSLGPVYLRIGSKATLPMIYVENCAEAMILAAERLAQDTEALDGEVINLVDDDLPTQQEYVDEVSTVISPPKTFSIPWWIVRLGADLLERANQRLVGGRAKFPGFIVPHKLHGRFKPLLFTNAKAKKLLGWQPRYPLSEAFRRSIGHGGHDG